MAKNIFLNQLNDKDLMDTFGVQEDDMMGEMPPIEQNRLANIPPTQPEPQTEPLPKDLQEQLFSAPKLADVVSPKPEQPEAPMLAEADTQKLSPEAPMSKSEALLAEYNKMLGRDQKSLEEARSRDRMLKVGGSIGDALATYLNAKSQMNVKAPGVQVQQGAGLGKVADMFATAPEIASDVAQRREALMKQYAELAKGERSQAAVTSKEKIAEERNKTLKEAAGIKASGMQGARSFREERANVQDERYVKDKMLGLKKDFRKDYRYKDSYKEDLAFDQVDKLMSEAKKGNQIAFNAVGTKMARAMSEVGVLTESDVNRYVQGGSLSRKAGDSLLRMINGKPSEATMGDINEITNVLRETHSSRIAPLFEDYANDAVQQLGKTREQAYKELGFPLPPELKNEDTTESISKDDELKIGTIIKSGKKRYRVIDDNGKVEEIKK